MLEPRNWCSIGSGVALVTGSKDSGFDRLAEDFVSYLGHCASTRVMQSLESSNLFLILLEVIYSITHMQMSTLQVWYTLLLIAP